MRPTSTRPLGVLAAIALGVTAGCSTGPDPSDEARESVEQAQAQRMAEPLPVDAILDHDLLVRAAPDECFEQIGVDAGNPPCAVGSTPKINQTDLTAGVRSGDFGYFGTTANAMCLGVMHFFDPLAPFATDNLVCELGNVEDMRPPMILWVNAVNDHVLDITPDDDPLLATTMGLIGAGAHEGVVLLAGPNLGPDGLAGVNLFAFEGATGRMIGSTNLPEYDYMGTGIVVGGELYLGVSLAGERPGMGGAIVRYAGNLSDPFRFDRVGELDAVPGDLVEHEGRIAVAAMAGVTPNEAVGEMTGIYLSPVVPENGLRRADIGRWEKIFSMDDYEPDPVIARATFIGDLESFHGRLFFTTSQIPLYQTMNAFTAYGRPETWFGRLFAHAHSERSVALMVMDDVGDEGREITLLYGEAELPVFDPVTGRVEATNNNLGQEPRFGRSGFGNPMNQYAGEMTVFEDRLYIGTLDTSGAGPDTFGALTAQEALLDLPEDVVAVFDPLVRMGFDELAGADLYRMDTPYSPLVAEDLSGLGNPYNLKIGVLLPFEEMGKLYAGTSNPFNLRTGEDPGGFQLLSLTPRAE